MVQITELTAKSDALSFNQATRWVMTKEDHASAIIDKVTVPPVPILCAITAPTSPTYEVGRMSFDFTGDHVDMHYSIYKHSRYTNLVQGWKLHAGPACQGRAVQESF